MSIRAAWRLGAAVMLTGVLLGLSACGGSEPPPVARLYTQPAYGYLTKLRLNVAAVSIEDRTPPAGPDDIAGQAPTPPNQALLQMGRERVLASGTAGRAVLAIDQASLRRGNDGAINGQLAVHLDVLSGDGQQKGYAEARVARSHTPGSDPEDAQSVSYDLVTQMMADMNVELEFQVRRNLRDWLLRAGAAPGVVKTESLAAPSVAVLPGAPLIGTLTGTLIGTPGAATLATPGTADVAIPPAAASDGTAAIPPEQDPSLAPTPDGAAFGAPAPAELSPPPGVLHLPGQH